MRAYMNSIVIAGNVVRPGKKMFTKAKKPYILFTVAVERPRIQGKDMGTDFVNCCTYINWHHPILLSEQIKGRQAIVVGRLNAWVTKEGDTYKNGYQIVTDRLSIVPPLDKHVSGDDNVDGGEYGASEDEGEVPF